MARYYFLLAVIGLLTGCGQGDRGGISIGSGNENSLPNIEIFSSASQSTGVFSAPSNNSRASITSQDTSSSTSTGTLPSSASSASSENSDLSSVGIQKPQHLIANVGKCLELKLEDYLDTSKEGKLWSWSCYAKSSNQQWFWKPEGQIVSLNGHCLTAGEFNEFEGYDVLTRECDSSSAQIWQLDEQSLAVTNDLHPGYCLDIWNSASENNGKIVQLYTCTKNYNQRWATKYISPIFIRSVPNESLYIHINPSDQLLEANPISEGWVSATWQMEPLGDAVRFRNSWILSQFLNFNDGIEAGEALWGWHSSRWYVIPQKDLGHNVYSLRNYWKPLLYIGLDASNNLKIDSLDNLVDGSQFWTIDNEFLGR